MVQARHSQLAEENVVGGGNEDGGDDETTDLDHERHPVGWLRLIRK